MALLNKRHVVIAVGALVTVGAVAYFAHGMQGHWAEMGRAFAKANYLYLLPAIGSLVVVYVLRITRWKLFLKPIADVSTADVATATVIGFMSSCVLPLRPGEIIRPYVLHRKSGLSFGKAAGTAIGLERTFDLIGMLFLLFVTFSLLWFYAEQAPDPTAAGTEAAQQVQAEAQTPPDAQQNGQRTVRDWLVVIRKGGLQVLALVGIGLAGLGVLAFFPEVVLRVGEACLSVLPQSWRDPLLGLLRSVVESMEFLRSPGRIFTALGLTAAMWMSFPMATYFLARGFDLQMPFAGIMLAQSFITVAVIAPQAPGFLGVYQAAVLQATRLFGVAAGNAGAFANMLWAINVIPITIVGLTVLYRQGLSLTGLAEGARKEAGRSDRDRQE